MKTKLFNIQFTARSRSDAEHQIPLSLGSRVEDMCIAAFAELIDEGVLDLEVNYQFRFEQEDKVELTEQELFDLGAAYASFGLGEIDQGIHLILPVRDVETGAEMNDVFTSLCNRLEQLTPGHHDGYSYQMAINDWCHEKGINTGR